MQLDHQRLDVYESALEFVVQGNGIIEWAVIDLVDGKVWFAPEANDLCPYTEGPDDPEPPPGWYEVHEDSSLLYLYGCDTSKPIGHTMNARFVYLWQNGAAHLLRVDGR